MSSASGAAVYVPDDEQIWLPGKVSTFDRDAATITVTLDNNGGDRTLVLTDEKTLIQLTGSSSAKSKEALLSLPMPLPLQNPDSGPSGVEDMTDLNALHEAAILYNVKTRFQTENPCAGKTETTKILMQHIASIATKKSDGQDKTIQAIIEANPLLEAFGNAKTVRNNNSSRFGKFTQLQFDGQMCLTAEWQFICGGSGEKIEGLSDLEHYEHTQKAMDIVGFSAADQKSIFKAVAAVLHLGELEIEGDDETSSVAQGSNGELAFVSQLMGCTEADVTQAFTMQQKTAGREKISSPLSHTKAVACRDALSRALYSKLFDWLVTRINKCLMGGPDGGGGLLDRQICVLDIFGFENFTHNSYEQLCINYANEKLQQKFTADVFKTVQEEYRTEGVSWDHVDFADNAPLLNLLEGRMGIISLLNEECLRAGTDESFVRKVKTMHGDGKVDGLTFPRSDLEVAFTIQHYAGAVTYQAEGFNQKNKDALFPDIEALMQNSTCSFIGGELFPKPKGAGGSVKKRAGKAPPRAKRRASAMAAPTVGTQFKQSLAELMIEIGHTASHYVRCIKPNSDKSPSTFSLHQVALQLRCAGVIEAIRISLMAYPNKMTHADFLDRYQMLVNARGEGAAAGLFIDKFVPQDQMQDACEEAMRELKRQAESRAIDIDETDEEGQALLAQEEGMYETPEKYQVGATRIYFQAGVQELLEGKRSRLLAAYHVLLQSVARGFLARRMYARHRAAAVRVQANVRSYLAATRFHTMREGALVGQALWRGRAGRRAAQARRREKGAVRLQSAARGRAARRGYREARGAAARIQSVARMRQGRAVAGEVRRQRERDDRRKAELAELDHELEALLAGDADAAAAPAKPAAAKAPGGAAEGDGEGTAEAAAPMATSAAAVAAGGGGGEADSEGQVEGEDKAAAASAVVQKGMQMIHEQQAEYDSVRAELAAAREECAALHARNEELATQNGLLKSQVELAGASNKQHDADSGAAITMLLSELEVVKRVVENLLLQPSIQGGDGDGSGGTSGGGGGSVAGRVQFKGVAAGGGGAAAADRLPPRRPRRHSLTRAARRRNSLEKPKNTANNGSEGGSDLPVKPKEDTAGLFSTRGRSRTMVGPGSGADAGGGADVDFMNMISAVRTEKSEVQQTARKLSGFGALFNQYGSADADADASAGADNDHSSSDLPPRPRGRSRSNATKRSSLPVGAVGAREGAGGSGGALEGDEVVAHLTRAMRNEAIRTLRESRMRVKKVLANKGKGLTSAAKQAWEQSQSQSLSLSRAAGVGGAAAADGQWHQVQIPGGWRQVAGGGAVPLAAGDIRGAEAALESRRVQQLIARWSKGSGRKQAQLDQWLRRVLRVNVHGNNNPNHMNGVNGLVNGGGGGLGALKGMTGVELSDLTAETSAEFQRLVIPLLDVKTGVRVVVHTRAQEIHSLRVRVEEEQKVGPGAPMVQLQPPRPPQQHPQAWQHQHPYQGRQQPLQQVPQQRFVPRNGQYPHPQRQPQQQQWQQQHQQQHQQHHQHQQWQQQGRYSTGGARARGKTTSWTDYVNSMF